jgi:hypothetical protein
VAAAVTAQLSAEPWAAVDGGSVRATLPRTSSPDLDDAVRDVVVHWRPLSREAAGGFAVLVELDRIEFPATGRRLDGQGLLLRWQQVPLIDEDDAELAAREHARLRDRLTQIRSHRVEDGAILPLLHLVGRSDDGRMWNLAVVERAWGGSLLDMVGRFAEGAGPHPWARGIGFRHAARVLAPVVVAFLELHSFKNLEHRDVTPANVVLRDRLPTELDDERASAGRAALIDFDFTREMVGYEVTPLHVEEFLPPEVPALRTVRTGEAVVYTDEAAADQSEIVPGKIDVWQLAVLWCYLACGTTPFAGEDWGDRRRARRDGVVSEPACLERAAEHGALADDLAAFLREDPRRRANMQDLWRLVTKVGALEPEPAPSAELAARRAALDERIREATLREPERPPWWARLSVTAPWGVLVTVLAVLGSWRLASPYRDLMRTWSELERAVMWSAGGVALAVGLWLVGGRVRALLADPRRPTSSAGVLAVFGGLPAVLAPWLLVFRVTDGAGPVAIAAAAGTGLVLGTAMALFLLRAPSRAGARPGLLVVVLAVSGIWLLLGTWWWDAGGAVADWWPVIAGLAAVSVFSVGQVERLVALGAAGAAVVLVLVSVPGERWALTWAAPPAGEPVNLVLRPDLDPRSEREPVASTSVPSSTPPATGVVNGLLDEETGRDERDFAALRLQEDDGEFGPAQDEVTDVRAGQVYELTVEAHNGAVPAEEGAPDADVRGLRLRVDVPSLGMTEAVVLPRLTWNGGPRLDEALADPVRLSGPAPFSLVPVAGSARALPDSGPDRDLDDAVANGAGVPIGSGGELGVLAAGHRVTVVLLVEVREPGTALGAIVRPSDQGARWSGTATVAPGQPASVAVYVRNDDVVQHESVLVSAHLVEGLRFVPRSTTLIADGDADAVAQRDTLVAPGPGTDIGPLQPGSSAWVQFRVEPLGLCDTATTEPVEIRVRTSAGELRTVVDVLVPVTAC